MSPARHGPREIDATPAPSALMESLRSFGYSPATAIADVVDNSVSAGATVVDISMHWAGPDSWVAIVDDGSGMTSDEISGAMRPGSSNPLDNRQTGDLGRFGLGLKTASFSQSRVLTVATQTSTTGPEIRCWDLDHVQRTDRWVVLDATTHDEELIGMLPAGSGTVVSWRNLDRIVDGRSASDESARTAFYATVDEVRAHVEMVFHRFLERGLSINVNRVACSPWDPFLVDHDSTETIHTEPALAVTHDGDRHRIVVTPYVLPHRSRLTHDEHRRAAGPRGWNLQQGFYLYRSDRLIVTGDWFDRNLKPEEHHKLARISVEVSHELDALWDLDVRKAKARPPAALRGDFHRIARSTRERAERVYRSRGNASVGVSRRSGPAIPVWQVHSTRSGVGFRLNREHPVVAEAFERCRPATVLSELVRFVERYLPADEILSQGYRGEDRLVEPQPDADDLQTARRIFCNLVAEGADIEVARRAVAGIQPFRGADAYLESLDEESCR